MKILLVGIEYVGTTTIANLLAQWKTELTGEAFYMGLIHDHSKLPHTSGHPDDTTLEEQQQILNLSPKLKEMYHRYGIYYHLHHYVHDDDLSIGLHIEESIYARHYYQYGLEGDRFDRESTFDQMEKRIKQITDDPIILVHLTAEPEVIKSRMVQLKDSPEHSNSPLREEDIEAIMSDYQRLVDRSTIGPVIKLDTSTDTPEQTLGRLVPLLEPHFTASDKHKIDEYKSSV